MIMVVTLTAGAIFVMWLGEQITERGIGNGQSLLITFSILERLWPATIQLAGFVKGGVVGPIGVLFYFAVTVAVIAAVVAMTIASRRIPVQIPRKVMGRGRIREGQKTFIPIRIITAGVMPIIFAQTIIIVPGTIANFLKIPALSDMAAFFAPGTAAVQHRVRPDDRAVQLLLHLDHLQLGRPVREPEEAGRVRPGRASRCRHRRLHRRRAGPRHAARARSSWPSSRSCRWWCPGSSASSPSSAAPRC